MNDAEKLKLEEELKKLAPLIARLSEHPDVLPERVRAALNLAWEKQFPSPKELTEKQMEVFLLKLIAQQPTSGFDLVDAIVKAQFRVGREGDGAIYALLADMEADELVEGEWREGEHRMIKSYKLTTNGRKRIEKEPAVSAEMEIWVQAVLHKT